MHEPSSPDWLEELKAKAAARKINDEKLEEQNSFHVKTTRSVYKPVYKVPDRRTPTQQRASSAQTVKATKSIMEMHIDQMARLRKRFMPPLRKD